MARILIESKPVVAGMNHLYLVLVTDSGEEFPLWQDS